MPSEVSGVLLAALEKLNEMCIGSRDRTHNRIRSPRLAASDPWKSDRKGKSAKQIRNFGKRIGSEGWA